MKHLKRTYKCNDAQMFIQSSAMQRLFVESLADFTAFDSMLDINYANAWLSKIEEAVSIARNSQLKDIQAQKTDRIKAVMTASRDKYHEVKFFAFKAYSINDKHREKFGTKTFAKAKLRAPAMVTFMLELYVTCIESQAILLSNGMNLASIEAIATLSEELKEVYTDREGYRRLKRTLTINRIELLNECYQYTRTVCDAAMLIYRKDFARKKAFVFSAKRSTVRP